MNSAMRTIKDASADKDPVTFALYVQLHLLSRKARLNLKKKLSQLVTDMLTSLFKVHCYLMLVRDVKPLNPLWRHVLNSLKPTVRTLYIFRIFQWSLSRTDGKWLAYKGTMFWRSHASSLSRSTWIIPHICYNSFVALSVLFMLASV